MPTNLQILPGLLVSASLPLNGSASLRRTATVANRIPCLESSVILTFAGATVTTNSGADLFPASSVGPEQVGNLAIENAAIAIFSDVWELSKRHIPITCLN